MATRPPVSKVAGGDFGVSVAFRLCELSGVRRTDKSIVCVMGSLNPFGIRSVEDRRQSAERTPGVTYPIRNR